MFRLLPGIFDIVPLQRKEKPSKRQEWAGDWSQRRTRWKGEVPVVMRMGDLSQPRKPGPEES